MTFWLNPESTLAPFWRWGSTNEPLSSQPHLRSMLWPSPAAAARWSLSPLSCCVPWTSLYTAQRQVLTLERFTHTRLNQTQSPWEKRRLKVAHKSVRMVPKVRIVQVEFRLQKVIFTHPYEIVWYALKRSTFICNCFLIGLFLMHLLCPLSFTGTLMLLQPSNNSSPILWLLLSTPLKRLCFAVYEFVYFLCAISRIRRLLDWVAWKCSWRWYAHVT